MSVSTEGIEGIEVRGYSLLTIVSMLENNKGGPKNRDEITKNLSQKNDNGIKSSSLVL